MENFKDKAQVHATNVWTRIKPRKRTVLGGIVILAIGGYLTFKGSNSTQIVAQKTARVESGDIINSIKVVGNTKITDQQTLTFGQEGTVKKVYVKEGQVVKKGDLLAELDKKTLSINMAQQGISIKNARINYEKLLTSISEGDIVGAKNNIDTTQRKLDIAKNELEDMMLSNGDTLQTKATNIQTVLLSTKSSILESKKILDSINQMFSITVKINIDDVDRLVSVKNPSYKDMTKTNYHNIQSQISILESTLNIIQSKTTTTINEMEQLQEKNKNMLNDLSTCLSNAKNAMDNSVVSIDLTQSKIDNRTSTLNNGSTTVISRLSSLNTEGKSLRATSSDIQNKKNEISNYESQLKIYQENYQDMMNGPSSSDRQLQLNSIRQSQLSLAQLSQQGENYEIKAPFDGNVDVINIKVGDNITSNIMAEKSITVSNPNIYEIDMLIDQVDIVKINKGQPVEVTFDAYPNYVVTGSISEIDPTPTTSAGVVSYTAKIMMVKGEKKIYDSMTVSVKIMTERKINTIIVPSMAIQTESGNTIVQVQERDGSVMSKKVVTGITDSSNTEILSGLNIGEKVYLETYTAAKGAIQTAVGPDGTKAQDFRKSQKGLGVGGSSAGGGNAGGPGM
ncbi:MAG: efflux RND transporter periplasmic adaptor subunit [Candidatus Absconditabacteria bacterium]